MPDETGVRKVVFYVREHELQQFPDSPSFEECVHLWADAVETQNTNLVRVGVYRVENV